MTNPDGNSRLNNDESGAYYDWTKTMKPESPWTHDYNQTVVMKLLLVPGRRGNVDKVYLTFPM